MTDVIHAPDDGEAKKTPRLPAGYDEEQLVALVELLFFAYRDFVGEPDKILLGLGFGRAHHRVLHFVNRNPGLRVADLLGVLKITKQSLGRVLKQLVDEGYVLQTTGPTDRRERRLHLTERGRLLANELLALQMRRMARALADAGPNSAAPSAAFLAGVIEASDASATADLVARAAGTAPAMPRKGRTQP
jgi:DNA-binding MarR family transcriptional regulator